MEHRLDDAVVILAGGQASRLPGKLELDVGGVPLIVRVYRNVAPAGPVYVCAAGSFRPEVDLALECPVIVDRWIRRGPLAGLYGALGCIRERRVFVVAGDAPFVDAGVLQELRALWEPGLQAVLPVNAAGHLEPLCALYERTGLIEAAGAVLAQGSGGVAAAVERLKTKRVRLRDERVLMSVNTATDRRALLEA